ncbi:hypothetical protein CRENBAI_018452 [Crenichthys baileyi]|uniref:Uncharacterized protein n=1 Tax=Crenichthys baileyi TaxID=28760 RepID=A0AAV9SAZ6_9TELE
MKVFCKTSGGAELQLGSPVAVKAKHLEAPQFFSTFTVRFYMTSSCCAGANQPQSRLRFSGGSPVSRSKSFTTFTVKGQKIHFTSFFQTLVLVTSEGRKKM